MFKQISIFVPCIVFATIAAAAAVDPTVLRRQSIPNAAIAATVDDWCAQAAAATRNRVRCAPARNIAGPADAYAALRSEEVDLGVVNHRDHPDRFPVSRIAELPRIGDFAETVSQAYQRLYERIPAMASEHRDLKVLAVFTDAPSYFFFRGGQLRSVAELKGREVTLTRAADDVLARALHLKASDDTDAPPAEDVRRIRMTTAADLLRAQDGKSFRTAAMVPGGLANVSYAFALSSKAWASLSSEDQRAVAGLSGAKLAGSFGHAIDAAEWKANMKQRGNGTVFYPVDEALAAELSTRLRPVDRAWRLAAKHAGVGRAEQELGNFRKDVGSRELAE